MRQGRVMPNAEHLAAMKRGVKHWNAWRKSNPSLKPNLSRAKLVGAALSKANLFEANLDDAELFEADLSHANLRNARMCGTELGNADLSGACLISAKLVDAYLDEASLTEANLSGAEVTRAWLANAGLTDANLQNSLLLYTQFFDTQMSGADLRGADISDAVFADAIMKGCNFAGATMGRTFFDGVDLSETVGLEHVSHDMPSSLSFSTILVSSGRIPLSFLRGVGLPDNPIDYLPSLRGAAIQFFTCFISYSSADQSFADRLYADLQNKGVRCWFAPHDVKGGRKLHEQVHDAIRIYDRLLLILSDHSMNSRWVETEIAAARKREIREGRRVLFPISLVPFAHIRDWNAWDADMFLWTRCSPRSYPPGSPTNTFRRIARCSSRAKMPLFRGRHTSDISSPIFCRRSAW